VDDTVLFDGNRPSYSNDPVPNDSAVTLRMPFQAASHRARFQRDDRRAELAQGHVAIAEFSY
jgi:hypothetical protein